jgi:hypothetical protein
MRYFDDVAVKPDIAGLYLKVMETIFEANESKADVDVKKLTEELSQAEGKLAFSGRKVCPE